MQARGIKTVNLRAFNLCLFKDFFYNKLPLIIRLLFRNLRFFPLLLQIGLCLQQAAEAL